MDEFVILLMILSGLITIIGYKVKSKYIILISSIGWVISGLQLITVEPDIPGYVIAFYLAIAAGVYFLVDKW